MARHSSRATSGDSSLSRPLATATMSILMSRAARLAVTRMSASGSCSACSRYCLPFPVRGDAHIAGPEPRVAPLDQLDDRLDLVPGPRRRVGGGDDGGGRAGGVVGALVLGRKAGHQPRRGVAAGLGDVRPYDIRAGVA